MKFKIKLELELEIEVEGRYIKADLGVHTYPNGDPGYEGTPEAFLIEQVLLNDNNIINNLSEEDLNCIEETILENLKNEEKDY